MVDPTQMWMSVRRHADFKQTTPTKG